MKKRLILISFMFVFFIAALIAYTQFVKPFVEYDSGEGTVMVETQDGETLGVQLRYQIFPQITREQLESIKVENTFGTFEFYRRSGEEFCLRGNEGTAINAEVFSELVVAAGYPLALLKVAPDSAGYAEYGLDEPICTWTVTATDGTSHTLRVGHKVHTGEGYYVCMDGRDAVYVLAKSIEKPLLSSVTEFVTPVVIAVGSQNDYYTIDKLSIFHGEEPFIAFGQMDKKNMMNPDAIAEMRVLYPAMYTSQDTEVWNLCMLMTGLSGDYTAAIDADDAVYEKYGLLDPAYTISFVYKEKQYVVFISEKLEDGGYYATSNFNPTVISHVEGETFEFLENDLFKWISPYVFGHYITQIQNITSQYGDGEVSFDLEHFDNESGNGGLRLHCLSGRDFSSEEELLNFRMFYRSLISVEMIDYTPLSKAEREALTSDESNRMYYFTFTTLAGKTTKIEFWPYTTRRCLVTLDGEGEFYVLIDRVEKLISDTEKLMTGVTIDSFAKN